MGCKAASEASGPAATPAPGGAVPLALVAWGTERPRNLGAMIRICACFGVALEVVEPLGFPLSSRELRQRALDYGRLCVPSRHDDWATFRRSAASLRPVLLTTGAERTIWDFAFAPGDALVVGSESAGVPPEVAADCAAALRIPMPGGGRSLNVAVAAAVALAEAMRQLARAGARGAAA